MFKCPYCGSWPCVCDAPDGGEEIDPAPPESTEDNPEDIGDE